MSIVDRNCARCDEPFTHDAAIAKGPRTSWCASCRRDYFKEWHRNQPRDCVRCGATFDRWQDYIHPGSAATHCNPCYLARARERYEAEQAKRRASQPAKVTLAELRQQVLDEETHCGICGEFVDRSDSVPRSRRVSVDHIIPRSLGGPLYDRNNLRLAHLGCNSSHHPRLMAALRQWQAERVHFLTVAHWFDERLNGPVL